MTYSLTFSTIQNGSRKPLYKDGQEVTLIVEVDSKTATYSNDEVIKFCNDQGNNCRVRRINNG